MIAEARDEQDEAVGALFTNGWDGLHIAAKDDLARSITDALAAPAARAQSAAACAERLRARTMAAGLAAVVVQLREGRACA